MFGALGNKVGKISQAIKKRAEITQELSKITAHGSKREYEVIIRGDKKIEKILVNGEENKILKDLINDTMKEVDKKTEKQMRGKMGDLADLLG